MRHHSDLATLERPRPHLKAFYIASVVRLSSYLRRSSSSCSSVRAILPLRCTKAHEAEGARARPLSARRGSIGRPTRAFGSLLVTANPQSTVPLPAARPRRGNTSWAQVPGVDGASIPGIVLHRRLRTRRPAGVRRGGRTCAGQNDGLPNDGRGLSRARSPAGTREGRVAFGSPAAPSAAALSHLRVLASGLTRRSSSGGTSPFHLPPPQKA